MKNNLFNLSESEKNQIRSLHESYKKVHGTITLKEQTDANTELEVSPFLEIPLAGVFGSGEVDIVNQAPITDAKNKISDFLSKYPKSQSISIKIVAGESQVPNQPPYEKVGSLAKARAENLKTELQKNLGDFENITFEEPEIVIGETEWNPSLGKDADVYTKEQFANAIITPFGKKIVPKQFCKNGNFIRNQRYYPGYSPMLGNNWKVDVPGHPNFGSVPPTYSNTIMMICPNNETFIFPLEEDFQTFKKESENQGYGKFDNTLYKYKNNEGGFPFELYPKTLQKMGTSGNNIGETEDDKGNPVVWYHPSPVPLDSTGARQYLGVSSREHLDWPKTSEQAKTLGY